MVHRGSFGSCCRDLADAMTTPSEKSFRVEKSGILYLTVGSTRTHGATGFYDQAVKYCPFCGKHLQTKADIARKASV